MCVPDWSLIAGELCIWRMAGENASDWALIGQKRRNNEVRKSIMHERVSLLSRDMKAASRRYLSHVRMNRFPSLPPFTFAPPLLFLWFTLALFGHGNDTNEKGFFSSRRIRMKMKMCPRRQKVAPCYVCMPERRRWLGGYFVSWLASRG